MKNSLIFKFCRLIYTLLLTVAVPILFLRLLFRSLKNPAYRQRWPERLGIFQFTNSKSGFKSDSTSNSTPNVKPTIWIHAVSVGEVVAAAPLIKAIQSHSPDLSITVTTTTPTGSMRLKQLFPDNIFHVYFPWDFPFAIKQFLKRIQPKYFIVMETELWPNCFSILHQKKIPILIANARLSNNSFHNYLKFKPLINPILHCVSTVCAQSKSDGERFLQLGLSSEKLKIAGNIKYDLTYPNHIIQQALQLRNAIGLSRPIWVAASTHMNEEASVLNAFKEVIKIFPEAFLILVPRHPERFQTVIDLVKNYGFSFTQYSHLEHPITPISSSILIGDTIGALPIFYHASDIAFVGGSLVPIGGHNPIEPAVAGIPILMGPHTHNFSDICKDLKEANALVQIDHPDSLADIIVSWIKDKNLRIQMGTNAQEIVNKNKGAVQNIMNELQNNFSETALLNGCYLHTQT